MPTRPLFLLSVALVLVGLPTTRLLAAGPDPILLWPDGAPGAVGEGDEDKPQLWVYLPEGKAAGAGVVICPGGGYRVLATDHEGHQVAKWFNSIGVAAFVVKYRLGPRYRHPAPLQDVQRAIRFVRSRAEKFQVAADRIGVMGFSAGGHLASTAATHFTGPQPASTDPIERVGSRPDFAVLCYPVISLTADFAHRGSARSLLGESPDKQLLEQLSNERQVTAETPPTFLFHTAEDPAVPVENSLAFFAACRRAGVPAELHVYQNGPHGVGLAAGDPVARTWRNRLADWLQTSGFLADVSRAAVSGEVRVDGEMLRWGMITFIPQPPAKKPVAFAMVSRGQFKIPAGRGAVVGPCRVQVHDLGSVEPRPTVEDVVTLVRDEPVVVGETDNHFDLQFATGN